MHRKPQLVGPMNGPPRARERTVTQTRLESRNVAMRFANKGDQRNMTRVVTAVTDVNLRVSEGEVVSLIGPSGCGKSTLLNLGSGLDCPTEGEILVDDKRITGPTARAGISQSSADENERSSSILKA